MTISRALALSGEDRSASSALVCFAVREEAQFFTVPNYPVTDVLITGIGAQRASQAVTGYLVAHQPQLVLTCGFAGGLNPKHQLGQVLYDDTDGGPFQNRIKVTGALSAKFVHSDRVVVTAGEKAERHRTSGADAVEMESSAIASVCRERGIPVMVVRVISDTASEDLPMDFNRYSTPDGGLSMPKLLLGIAKSPSTVPQLIQFQGRLKQAARSLGKTLERFLSSSDLFRSG